MNEPFVGRKIGCLCQNFTNTVPMNSEAQVFEPKRCFVLHPAFVPGVRLVCLAMLRASGASEVRTPRAYWARLVTLVIWTALWRLPMQHHRCSFRLVRLRTVSKPLGSCHQRKGGKFREMFFVTNGITSRRLDPPRTTCQRERAAQS